MRILTNGLDERFAEFRKGGRYENARQSDVRLFFIAAQQPQHIAALAKLRGVSRQAAQKSVQRLVAYGVVELQALPGGKRDKQVVLTERGRAALGETFNHLNRVEAEIAAAIGAAGLEHFRQTLLQLCGIFASDELRRAEGSWPSVSESC